MLLEPCSSFHKHCLPFGIKFGVTNAIGTPACEADVVLLSVEVKTSASLNDNGQHLIVSQRIMSFLPYSSIINHSIFMWILLKTSCCSIKTMLSFVSYSIICWLSCYKDNFELYGLLNNLLPELSKR